MARTILAIVTTLLLWACTRTEQPVLPPEISYNYISTQKTTPPAHHNNISGGHTLVQYNQSNCKSNNLTEKILHKALRADTLIIKIRSTQICNEKYAGNFSFTNNDLNLTLERLPKIVKRKNGETDTIHSVQECDCPYEFTYTINRVRSMPTAITLNGKLIN